MIQALVFARDSKLSFVLGAWMEECADIKLVACCSSLDELTRFFPVDLVFIDLDDEPDICGLLPAGVTTVLLSSRAEYAVDAYNIDARDFLLKPISKQRFQSCLYKVRNKALISYSAATQSDNKFQLASVYKTRLIVRDPGRFRFVDVSDIDVIKGAGNYVDLLLRDGRHLLHRETLSNLERKLNPADFVRVNRSFIIRFPSIMEVRANIQGEYTIVLRNERELTLSKRSRQRLTELLEVS
ncbi:LytTR family DNA-binding domain-containing protein [Bowmanella sp. Y26]|uniref:LytR/AlgR family response regulator transcription factor n=1 Tax=Bowmanella yangjiangensis TaxID=2811230 RepID=UPI001BDD2621|nr:LytTR family DNA-binding domain-containing protein [Bowmanella yangjiangensis]MBT1064720.1 LytTR family DNA-binding domain-containing protein [Bowmanella yangjiangensis]